MLFGRNLTKAYRQLIALDSASVEVLPGRLTIVMGPSGSGKTTLLRALALLDPPDSGEVVLEGVQYRFPNGRELLAKPPWPRVTVVFQQLFLWPHLTLRENILLPLQSAKLGDTRLDELAELFQMNGFIDRYPNEASIGQRQRAALARALAVDPKYMLLDEITSALDIEQTGTILKYLLSLRDKGIGILLITHQIGFARRLLERREGDKLIFMDGGRVLEEGGLEILEKPTNSRVQRFMEESRTAI